MTRVQLEHILRAAGDIADDIEIIVIGSQAILGRYPNAPDALLVSVEADVYPKNVPARWELIDGCIGEGSPFHETFGYYAQGVEEGTAILPDGWKARLVPVKNANTRGITGWCLEPHDLVLSKYVAGRDKDRRFARDALRFGLVQREELELRLGTLPVEPGRIEQIRERIRVDASS
ncbi:DUF6036 family nucleotidyltransferase [Pendulispora albinea]|uniref:DUF6036 domain-containing protein n=1 Tax=Pendulispora albinea TaxID=2741071 RepID=A0ABZ2M9G3_9BACT